MYVYSKCHFTITRMVEIFTHCLRAPDKGVFDDNFSYFSLKPYVMTPHLICLTETVKMRGHNICFYGELSLIMTKYCLLSRALHCLQGVSCTVNSKSFHIWSISE